MKKLAILFVIAVTSAGWITVMQNQSIPGAVAIPPSPQRSGGDAQKGYDYLVNGDYVRGGVPFNLFVFANRTANRNFLERTGYNKELPHDFTAYLADNGEVLVAPNCLQCHSQQFDGKLFIGMGNSLADFTPDPMRNVKNLGTLEKYLKLTAPRKYEAAQPFIKVTRTIDPYINVDTRGVNIASRLAAVLAAHRDPVTLKWSDEEVLPIPEQIIPSDVPAWWLMKKKNGMFYNGFGRGDFGKFLMASNLLVVRDTSEASDVDRHMPDLLAYINSIEAPAFTKPIDAALAKQGEEIFINSCSKCHGTYGEVEEYPNLLIPEEIIQTDSLLYNNNYQNPQFIDWFNKSWFTKGEHPARLEPFRGYIAPPLDGVWATAPYLHNGSVPTLKALLDSRLRPEFWSRDFNKPLYDYDAVGWKFKEHKEPGGKSVYNTNTPGYGNYGHYFGDRLNPEEKRAMLEYLKTL